MIITARELKEVLDKFNRRNFEPDVEDADNDRLIYLLAELKRVECLVTVELTRRSLNSCIR